MGRSAKPVRFRFTLLLALSVVAVLSAGCGAVSEPPPPQDAKTLERVAYHGWPDAYRLHNDAVELVVVPAVARIMRFARLGGENVLWENSGAAGLPVRADEWVNFGGDKVWIWPQADWPRRTGSEWPPPTDVPAALPHSARAVDTLTLRLESPVIPGFGARIVREIRLEATGTRVHITSRLEQVGTETAMPMAAWVVAQLPADGQLFARLTDGSSLQDGYRLFWDEDFASVKRVEGNILVIERPPSHSAKLGVDGDMLAWLRGEELFVMRSTDSGSPPGDFGAGERAQIYSHLDGDPALPAGVSYVELEMTSPVEESLDAKTVTLETTWELVTLSKAECSVDEVAQRLASWPDTDR